MTTEDSLQEGHKNDGELPETRKKVAPRGRPKSKPDSKAMIFHLPLDLIALIDVEAEIVTTGNKSALAVKVFSEYFAAKTSSS